MGVREQLKAFAEVGDAWMRQTTNGFAPDTCLACPFCRSEGVHVERNFYCDYHAECANCGAKGPTNTRKSLAVAAWNEALRKQP